MHAKRAIELAPNSPAIRCSVVFGGRRSEFFALRKALVQVPMPGAADVVFARAGRRRVPAEGEERGRAVQLTNQRFLG